MSMSCMKIALPTQYPPCVRQENRWVPLSAWTLVICYIVEEVHWTLLRNCERSRHRYRGVAVASLRGDFATLGVNVTEGEGNLPKVVLTSPSGRWGFSIFTLISERILIFLIACRVANFALWSFGMKLWNVYNFISIFSVADVYLYGGCITSWRLANGKDLLFVRPDAVFNKKKPIRFLPAWFSFRLFLLFYVSIARSSIPGK